MNRTVKLVIAACCLFALPLFFAIGCGEDVKESAHKPSPEKAEVTKEAAHEAIHHEAEAMKEAAHETTPHEAEVTKEAAHEAIHHEAEAMKEAAHETTPHEAEAMKEAAQGTTPHKAEAEKGLAKKKKPSPYEAIALLKDGNKRFVEGKSTRPHTDSARLIQAGKEDQGDHAYATVITCSDSRVPVEHIFDAGVMDIFVIRVAGNVCDVDEIGSIEYGLAHVHTPVLVVLGHTQCGAVTAVTHALHGKGHAMERNIPPLVDNIEPAVRRAMSKHPGVHGDDIIPYAIEENIWQAIEDLFMNSPATRDLVNSGAAKVVGAMYDVSTGKVDWLPESKVSDILVKVEANPMRAMMKPVASGGH